jgi:hypothetical protein
MVIPFKDSLGLEVCIEMNGMICFFVQYFK